MPISPVQLLPLASGASVYTLGVNTSVQHMAVGNFIVAVTWGCANETNGGPTHHVVSPGVICQGSSAFTDSVVVVNSTNYNWCAISSAIVASAATEVVECHPRNENGDDVQGILHLVITEFTGISSLANVSIGISGTGGTPSPGSLSDTSGALTVAVMCNGDTSNPATVTTPAGYTSISQQLNGAQLTVGEAVYEIDPGTPINPTWNTASNWACAQACYLPFGGGSGGQIPVQPIAKMFRTEPKVYRTDSSRRHAARARRRVLCL